MWFQVDRAWCFVDVEWISISAWQLCLLSSVISQARWEKTGSQNLCNNSCTFSGTPLVMLDRYKPGLEVLPLFCEETPEERAAKEVKQAETWQDPTWWAHCLWWKAASFDKQLVTLRISGQSNQRQISSNFNQFHTWIIWPEVEEAAWSMVTYPDLPTSTTLFSCLVWFVGSEEEKLKREQEALLGSGWQHRLSSFIWTCWHVDATGHEHASICKRSNTCRVSRCCFRIIGCLFGQHLYKLCVGWCSIDGHDAMEQSGEKDALSTNYSWILPKCSEVSRNCRGAVRCFCASSISRKEKADKAAAEKQRKEKDAKAGRRRCIWRFPKSWGSPKLSISFRCWMK